ncbi:MAG: DUF6514 family protein [Oscillospiraceae bacterium]|nr:DUF6514 family protein [Oscillospiraceae bacterium]
MHSSKNYPLGKGELTAYLTLTSAEVVDEQENIRYTTYGVSATDETDRVFYAAPDVSTDKERLKCFLTLCAEHEAHPLHIPDLVEDFLD